MILFLLSRFQCLTFLPLRTEPLSPVALRYIAIGFVNDSHFIEVSLFLYGIWISHSVLNISYQFTKLLCLCAVTLGHPVPLSYMSSMSIDFQRSKDRMSLTKNKCKCISIYLAVIILLDVQSQLTETSFEFEFFIMNWPWTICNLFFWLWITHL